MDFVQGYRDVLGIVAIEAPQFAAGSWLRDTVAIVVEKNGIVLGLSAHGLAEAAKVLERGVQDRFVRDLETEALELVLEV